jgi:hypothetical protein
VNEPKVIYRSTLAIITLPYTVFLKLGYFRPRVNPFLISFILSLDFSGDIKAFLSSLRPPFLRFHRSPPLGFLTVLRRWFPPNLGRMAGLSSINVDSPNSFRPCAGDSSGASNKVRFPVPLSLRFFFLWRPASRTELFMVEVLAVTSPIDISESMVVSTVSSRWTDSTEAARLDLLPPKTGMLRPMMDVFAAWEGDG